MNKILSTEEELLFLPEHSVIIDKMNDVHQKRGGLWCSYESAPFASDYVMRKYGPVLLLHEGPWKR